MVVKILKGIKEKEKTLIVSPDPGQIVPLISQISQVVETFNISMGYPVKRSGIFALIVKIFQAQESMKKGLYYTKDYLKVITNPYIKNITWRKRETIIRILIHKIEDSLRGRGLITGLSGQAFISLEDIINNEEIIDQVLKNINKKGVEITYEQVKEVGEYIHQVLFKQWEKIDTFQNLIASIKHLLDILIEAEFYDELSIKY